MCERQGWIFSTGVFFFIYIYRNDETWSRGMRRYITFFKGKICTRTRYFRRTSETAVYIPLYYVDNRPLLSCDIYVRVIIICHIVHYNNILNEFTETQIIIISKKNIMVYEIIQRLPQLVNQT